MLGRPLGFALLCLGYELQEQGDKLNPGTNSFTTKSLKLQHTIYKVQSNDVLV